MKYSYFLIFLFLSFCINAQERQAWDYPVKPGTDEWKKFQSNLFGYESKLEYVMYFAGIGFRSNVYSRVQIISKIDATKLETIRQKDNNYAFFSGIADEQSFNAINELSYQLSK